MKQYKIPYGLSDYKTIKTGNYLYVDKTKYIEELENLNNKYPVFLRPRRFGKSLFVSTLYYYYDRNSKEDFEELFGDTYIGKYKTESASQYHILRLDFSGLDGTNEERLRKAFYGKVHAALRKFIRYYKLDIDIIENDNADAAMLLNYFLSDFETIGSGLYVLIDEYDHFAINIVESMDFFGSATSSNGFVWRFYEIFKAYTGTGCVSRMFITGVTSMTLDSLTSGFNIAKNVSMFPNLNEMIGFTEKETRNLLEQLDINGRDEIMKLLIEHYNGYVFHNDMKYVERILNSNLIMYFLDEYSLKETIPHNMIDANIRSDYGKLTNMFGLYKNEESKEELLRNIMEGVAVDADIVSEFSLFSKKFSKDEFLSMLFYLGLLTIKGAGDGYDVALEPPNAVIRDVYYKYYADYLELEKEERRDAVRMIAYDDNFSELNRLITRLLQMHSNDDFIEFNERRFKTVVLSCFSDQSMYLIKSEYEANGKRPDIALFDIRGGKSKVKYNYLIELKYLKKSQASADEVEKVRRKAYSQMQGYLKLEEFEQDTRIKGLIYVVVKDEIRCFEEVEKEN